MLGKLTDTANILKAKITKDDLEQKLIQATTQENWQTPTNILHEIANAAHNYQKWQKINDFIWDKLKKKSSWRKIMKTLNLVDFLIKNGPPSAISSFKYEVYQFRTYSDYQVFDGGVDRGQAIRQKAKQIVQLLSNDQHLEDERQKSKKIRERMSSVTGGTTYGAYSGSSNGGYMDSKYESFNSKSYGEKPSSYGDSGYTGGLGVYGDYNSGKSNLDKYKVDSKPSVTSASIKPVSGSAQTSQDTKKPFEKMASKLIKPPSKSEATKVTPKKIQPTVTPPVSSTNNNNDFLDFVNEPTAVAHQNNSNGGDLLGSFDAEPINPINNNQQIQHKVQLHQPQPQQTQQTQNNLYNQPFSLTPQNQQPYQYQQTQPQYQTYQQSYQQQYPQQSHQYQQSQYQQPQYQQYQKQHVQQPQHQQFQFNQTPNISLSQQVTLTPHQPSLGLSQPQANQNIQWLSQDEKGLIDFSDFGAQLNSNSSNPKNNNRKSDNTSNNISIDNWNW